MADTDVGKKATRHNDHGEHVVCWVSEYVAGKDAGDHGIWGPTTDAERKAGAADTFRDWLQAGSAAGQFTVG